MANNMTAIAPKTNTVGFYNGNHWPIQIVISRLNVTLHLNPGEYILDRNRQKINDPIFEAYVNAGQLSKETSSAPVDANYVVAPQPLPAPGPHSTSVYATTTYTQDARGVRSPVIPAPQPVIQPDASRAPIVAMSMAEAKKLGYVKKVREVPEDFGVKDNDAALPPVQNAPVIRASIDSGVAANSAPSLPPQLESITVKRGGAERQQLIQTLAVAHNSPNPEENPTSFLDAVRDIPDGVNIHAGTVESAPDAIELDAPDIEESIPEPTVKAAQVKGAGFACIECGKTFKYRPELVGHARKKHPDKVDAILATYPTTS